MMELKIAKNADQVEHEAFEKGYASFIDGLSDEEISGEIEDFIDLEPVGSSDSTMQENWATADVYIDKEQGLILSEIEKRAKLLKSNYPFLLTNSSLRYRTPSKNEPQIYEALLITSLITDRRGGNWSELVSSFENLSAKVIGNFFQCTKTWWTEANSDQQFKTIIDEIHKHTGELEWNPDRNIINNHKRIKDAGIDFINYRRLIEKRMGGLFFFGQSACGDNWFNKTKTDLRTGKYERIFRKPYAAPVKIFVIPYFVNESVLVKANNNLSGLVFDRATLTHFLVNLVELEQDSTAELNTFCNLAFQNRS